MKLTRRGLFGLVASAAGALVASRLGEGEPNATVSKATNLCIHEVEWSGAWFTGTTIPAGAVVTSIHVEVNHVG